MTKDELIDEISTWVGEYGQHHVDAAMSPYDADIYRVTLKFFDFTKENEFMFSVAVSKNRIESDFYCQNVWSELNKEELFVWLFFSAMRRNES